MKNSIFIPKQINVGFQNRSDTYTKKLAYVIYFDEKGVLRKETSWNSWRDKSIENQVLDNVPTEGFVLNKNVGGYDSGWNHRNSYIRVYDPRGFEFEIGLENLLYILENTNSIKGKGLEGEFIYGWDGKDLVLIPTSSSDYKEIKEYNEVVHNKEYIKAKDLKVGATYLTKDNNTLIYMGKYRAYGYYENDKKQFWFAKKSNERYFAIDGYEFNKFKSITPNKIIKCIDENCTEEYPNIYNIMETSEHFSPKDENKIEIKSFTKEHFEECITKKFVNDKYRWAEFKCYSNEYGDNVEIVINRGDNDELIATRKVVKLEKYMATGYGFYRNEERAREIKTNEELIKSSKIEEIYNLIKPLYKNIYLKNNRLWKGRENNEFS